jgi:Xaa-Pro aminopeptidase
MQKYLTFPRSEFERRTQKARELMDGVGMDALLITAEMNYYYFSGHRGHAPWSTFTRPLVMILPKESDPVVLVHLFTEPETSSRTWVNDVRTYKSLTASISPEIEKVLREKHLEKGTIGCELGHEQRLGISSDEFLNLRTALPEARFLDASEVLWGVMIRKSPEEIHNLREACRITSAALDKCLREAHEGMTEKEIVSMLYRIMIEEGAELPGFAIICSGEGNYERISARATDRKIRRGEMLWIDASAIFQGYWSDFCRAGIVGGPSAEQNRLQDMVHEVTMNAVSKIAPGVGVAEIAQACADEMARFGYGLTFEAGRCGHGIGLMSTEPPHVAPYDPSILEPGMVMTVEPGIVNEHGVFCLEENVLVTESGYEVLSGGSRKLYTIE